MPDILNHSAPSAGPAPPKPGPEGQPRTEPCPVCPRQCAPAAGQRGWCGARVAKNGRMESESYGKITALALDPIEKKPLARFYPGSFILSVGSYGCNLLCPFCQNHEIAHPPHGRRPPLRLLPPEQLVERALALRPRGNIGIAYTYNEPGVGFEYVRDTARLAHKAGLKNVMVTNGWLCPGPWADLLPHIDAFNIDLKCFTEAGYHSLGGDLATVLHNIRAAQAAAHVEITTLVVPGLADSPADMDAQAQWLSSLSPELPLHLSRYFPQWQSAAAATSPALLHQLAALARRHLRHVFLGNL